MSSPSASVVVATAQVVGVIPAGESEPEFAPTAPPRPPTPERGGDGNTGAGNNQSDAWNPFEVEVTLEASNGDADGDADGNAAAAASAPGSPINFPVSAAAIPSATDSHMPSATLVTVASPENQLAGNGHIFVATAHPVGMRPPDVVTDVTVQRRPHEASRTSCRNLACILLAVIIVISVYFIIMTGVGSNDDDYNSSYYYAGSHGSYYSPHSYSYSSSCSPSDCYITLTSPTEGESYVLGDKVPVKWESAGMTENTDDGTTYVDVYYCTSYDADTSCYSNSDCTFLGEWYDSYKEGTIQFYYTTGTLYICLEDDYYTSPYGYSGAFTMSADRRRLAAPETAMEPSTKDADRAWDREEADQYSQKSLLEEQLAPSRNLRSQSRQVVPYRPYKMSRG